MAKDELAQFNLSNSNQGYMTENDVRTLVSSMLMNQTQKSRIAAGSLQSSNYVQGVSGWKLGADGTLSMVITTNWNAAYTHSIGNGMDHSKVTTHDGYLDQSVKTTATPSFTSIKIGASEGVTGSFTTVDGKTVTVTKGIITNIV